MTVPLSKHKTRRLLQLYFTGYPQPAISKKAGISQASVSNYTNLFAGQVMELGLNNAAKEAGIMGEVASLRSLAVELYKAKFTVEEARQGFNIIRAFGKLGVGPEQHLNLVKVCQEAGDPDFIKAALKLCQIESRMGTGYQQVISRLAKAQSELPLLENNIAQAKKELEATKSSLVKKQRELSGRKQDLAKYETEVGVKMDNMDKELTAKMKKLAVQVKEVEEVAALKAEIHKKGITLPTLIKLAKEFGHGNK